MRTVRKKKFFSFNFGDDNQWTILTAHTEFGTEIQMFIKEIHGFINDVFPSFYFLIT
jgi:hypothetical protein